MEVALPEERWNGPFGLVVVVGSMGALDPLRTILHALPPHVTVPLLVARHGSDAERLTEAVSRVTDRCVRPARDGARPEPSTVDIAAGWTAVDFAPDGRISTGALAPAPMPRTADATLRAASRAYGPRLLAVVLSGRLDDGSEGVRAVHAAGGRVLVQDPATAEAREMPRAAIATGCSQLVLPPAGLAAAITTLTAVPGGAELFRVRTRPVASASAAGR